MAQFPDTRWSLIQTARVDDRAFDEWCSIYFPPVAAYVRALIDQKADAEEVVQEFFLRLLKRGKEKALVNQLDGSFRAYLKRSVKNFVTDWHRSGRTQRRGGGAQMEPLETAESGENGGCPPDLLFDRAWIGRIMQVALEKLETELASRQRADFFQSIAPLLDGRDVDYATIAERFDMTPTAFRAALYRLRKRYRHLIEDELRQTVTNEEQFEEEKRHWRSVWQ